MPDFSGLLTAYTYLLFGSLLFVTLLAVARALLGAEGVLHHEITIDHGTEIGTGAETAHVGISGQGVESSAMELEHTETIGVTQQNIVFHESPTEPTTSPGLVKFQGMTLMTISIFLVSFAAMGILSLYYVVGPYSLDPLTSIPTAGASSAILALGISYAAFKYFIATAAGSEISLREVVGRPCEVIVGASGLELGEVRCSVKGQIMSFPARSLDGSRFNVGDDALIARMNGNIAVVQKRRIQ